MQKFQSVDRCREVVARDLAALPDDARNVDENTRYDRSANPWARMAVGIVTCGASYNRLENYLTIFEDIFQDLGLDYYLILADENVEPEDGSDFAFPEDPRVFVAKARESYETLAHKLAIFYAYICDHTDYDYVIKSDDGCLLDLSQLRLKPEADYAGLVLQPTLNTIHVAKCSDPAYRTAALDFGHRFREFLPAMSDETYRSLYDVRYAGGGYGYRLSRQALQAIAPYKRHVLSLGLSYEDVLFGQILSLEGIAVTPHTIGRYHAITGERL